MAGSAFDLRLLQVAACPPIIMACPLCATHTRTTHLGASPCPLPAGCIAPGGNLQQCTQSPLPTRRLVKSFF